MTVHVLLLRDQYDSDLLGVFLDPDVAKAAADRRFAVLSRTGWAPDGRGGQLSRLDAGGAHLRLRPCEVGGAR